MGAAAAGRTGLRSGDVLKGDGTVLPEEKVHDGAFGEIALPGERLLLETLKVATGNRRQPMAVQIGDLLEWVNCRKNVASAKESEVPTDSRTPRTGILPLTRVREEETEMALKDFAEGVRGVRIPYLEADGSLVIPFESPKSYHWWNGGQSLAVNSPPSDLASVPGVIRLLSVCLENGQ